jgi:hypothetical protein
MSTPNSVMAAAAKAKHAGNKFRSDMGQLKTLSLFVEHNYDYSNALYSWGDTDVKNNGKTYPSLKRLYMSTNDITEYEFAVKYFENWEHWQRMLQSPRILDMVEKWREELEIKMRSEAIRGIISESATDSKSSYAAKRWLADRGWDVRKAGAPSKDERRKQSVISTKISSEIAEDLQRMQEYH